MSVLPTKRKPNILQQLFCNTERISTAGIIVQNLTDLKQLNSELACNGTNTAMFRKSQMAHKISILYQSTFLAVKDIQLMKK